MRILVFDTCFNKTYIILKENDNILSECKILSTDENYHSAYLISGLRDILKKNNILISDIDAIGVNIGPGSFTGIRTSVTIARVLAQQYDIKLLGVSSLKILSRLNSKLSDTVTLSDARKNKVYYALYSGKNEVISPCLLDKDELLLNLKPDQVIISDSSISSFLSENNINSINFEENDEKLGLFLCETVEEMLKNSDNYNWAEVKPLYIQKPSITKPKEIKYV